MGARRPQEFRYVRRRIRLPSNEIVLQLPFIGVRCGLQSFKNRLFQYFDFAGKRLLQPHASLQAKVDVSTSDFLEDQVPNERLEIIATNWSTQKIKVKPKRIRLEQSVSDRALVKPKKCR